MGYVDRSSLRPLLRGERGELFCRLCDYLLGTVRDGRFEGSQDLVSKSGVACTKLCCLIDGAPTRTKITEALPIEKVEVVPLHESFSTGYQWSLIMGEGISVAAVCGEIAGSLAMAA